MSQYFGVMRFVGQTNGTVAEKLGFRIELLVDFQPALESHRFDKGMIFYLKTIFAHSEAQYIL